MGGCRRPEVRLLPLRRRSEDVHRRRLREVGGRHVLSTMPPLEASVG
jgi:hypothetical protein